MGDGLITRRSFAYARRPAGWKQHGSAGILMLSSWPSDIVILHPDQGLWRTAGLNTPPPALVLADEDLAAQLAALGRKPSPVIETQDVATQNANSCLDANGDRRRTDGLRRLLRAC